MSNQHLRRGLEDRRSKDAVEAAITLSKGDRALSWESGSRRLSDRLSRWKDSQKKTECEPNCQHLT